MPLITPDSIQELAESYSDPAGNLAVLNISWKGDQSVCFSQLRSLFAKCVPAPPAAPEVHPVEAVTVAAAPDGIL